MANEGSMPDPLVGLCFGKDDRLEVQRRLGQGGMGVVYYAWDEEKQRAVAIKVLLRQRADDPEFLRRFKHEGLRWKDIRHPALCRIYGLGCQHGYFYIVSEFVEGRDLDRALQEDGAQPVATLIQKMIQKDPRRRPESMAVVVSEIESIKAQLAAGSDDERKGLGGLLKSFWE